MQDDDPLAAIGAPPASVPLAPSAAAPSAATPSPQWLCSAPPVASQPAWLTSAAGNAGLAASLRDLEAVCLLGSDTTQEAVASTNKHSSEPSMPQATKGRDNTSANAVMSSCTPAAGAATATHSNTESAHADKPSSGSWARQHADKIPVAPESLLKLSQEDYLVHNPCSGLAANRLPIMWSKEAGQEFDLQGYDSDSSCDQASFRHSHRPASQVLSGSWPACLHLSSKTQRPQ